jgi:uncharacterized protein YciI
MRKVTLLILTLCILFVGCIEQREVAVRKEREHLATNVQSVATVQDSTSEPYTMMTYYMAFLRKGPKWTPDPTPEVMKISEAHMAHINKLAEEGSLIIAGPFVGQTGDSALAGMFLFKVDSEEKARELANADPAVKAGRFFIQIVPWMGPSTLRY